MSTTENTMSFEESMARLEKIVTQLERGDAPLEMALSLFEEGAGLLKSCQQQLDTAEQKVTLLTAGPGGRPTETEFIPKKV